MGNRAHPGARSDSGTTTMVPSAQQAGPSTDVPLVDGTETQLQDPRGTRRHRRRDALPLPSGTTVGGRDRVTSCHRGGAPPPCEPRPLRRSIRAPQHGTAGVPGCVHHQHRRCSRIGPTTSGASRCAASRCSPVISGWPCALALSAEPRTMSPAPSSDRWAGAATGTEGPRSRAGPAPSDRLVPSHHDGG